MTLSRLSTPLMALAIACGGPQPAPNQSQQGTANADAADEAAPVPPTLRLPRTVLPTFNRVELTLDPGKSHFEGRIEIDARVESPTKVFWLNADKLSISSAKAVVGERSLPLAIVPQQESFVGFTSAEALPAGDVKIIIEYTGQLDETETRGVFRQKEGGEWYAFTQFEATDARRAFPCFDEPDNKVPWQVVLDVPEALTPVANTPVETEKRTAHGTKRVTFAPTKPLPSYLVAFAVGPFDIVDGGKTRNGTPMRVIVPKGQGSKVDYVVESTGKIVELLEDYFGMPYPYAKLDTIAIPLTVWFGAMEHPGLISYVQDMLVSPTKELSLRYKRRYAAVAAHELAHQWFGNYVTMHFWNDIWLNEAFASWMGDKITHQFEPRWDGHIELVTRRAYALGADSLATARKIRQPIETKGDIARAFDGITYQKGGSVISMFEASIGETAFRDGVRAYLEKHAWSNASASDFLASLSEAADEDITGAFNSFLDQVGGPLVRVDLACEAGKPPRVTLAQERYRLRGSKASARQAWQLPVCVRYRDGKTSKRACTQLTEPTGELELTDASSCPSWLVPNADYSGYYRSELTPALRDSLLQRGLDQLSVAEQVGLAGDLNALVDAGRLSPAVTLALSERLAGHKSHHVVSQAVGMAARVSQTVPDSHRAKYESFVRDTFGKRAHKLGWAPMKEATDQQRLLRNDVVSIVSDDGNDAKLAAEARRLALAWIDDPNAVPVDMVRLVLRVAALRGDRALWETFLAAAKARQDRGERKMLLRAMGSFRAPAIVDASLDLVLAGTFDIRESLNLLWGQRGSAYGRAAAHKWVVTNYDKLAAKIPESEGLYLVYFGVAQCDAALRDEIDAFFGKRSAALPGGASSHAQAMESLDACVAKRRAETPAILEFLDARANKPRRAKRHR